MGGVTGVYTNIIPTEERSPSGSIICSATCKVCGKEVKGIRCNLLKVKSCRHRTEGPSIAYSKITDRALMFVFQGMVQRCYKEYSHSYAWYGDKGIGICNEWLQHPDRFQQWIEKRIFEQIGDIEWRRGMSIDRIDPSKGYSPENCRIIPLSQNTISNVRPITVRRNGEDITLSGSDWARRLGTYRTKVNYLRWSKGEDAAIEYILSMLEAEERLSA